MVGVWVFTIKVFKLFVYLKACIIKCWKRYNELTPLCKWIDKAQTGRKYTKGLYLEHTEMPYNSVIRQINRKWAKDLNIQVLKEVTQMINKHLKKCPTLLAIREMHIKITIETAARM